MNECTLCGRYMEDGYLCLLCTKQLRVRLECLPDLYQALAAYLVPSSSARTGRGARSAHAPLPVAELPLTMRGPGGMVGVTEDWLTLVHEERGMSAPVLRGTVEARLRSAAEGLWGNLPWIVVSWPLAGAFAEEIRDLVDAARSVIDPRERPDRGTRVGLCPAPVDGGEPCGAVLVLHTGDKALTCRWCSSSYPPAAWSDLKALMDADRRAASDAAV